jgi:hypothetical protein
MNWRASSLWSRHSSRIQETISDGERELKGAQFRQRATPTIGEDLIFKVGDFMYLKVPPMREFRRFKVQGKLAPRFIVPVQDHREKR